VRVVAIEEKRPAAVGASLPPVYRKLQRLLADWWGGRYGDRDLKRS